jgi:hypothetical protein
MQTEKRMMKHKYLALLAVVVLAGCAKTPEGTVQAFYKAVAADNEDEAISLLHPNATLLVGEDKVRAVLKQQSARIQGCGGISNVAVTLSDTPDFRKRGTATVNYKGGCKAVTERVLLVKVDDKWRIAP